MSSKNPSDGTAASPPDLGAVLAQVKRRQEILRQLQPIEARHRRNRERMVKALYAFQAVLPRPDYFAGESPRKLSALSRCDIERYILALCDTARDTGYHHGVEQILAADRPDADGNTRLAIDLYRRADAGSREGVRELLVTVNELPKFGDNFDHRAPCQRSVWEKVAGFFGYIVPWPDRGTDHPWHPDLLEAAPLHAELEGRPPAPEPATLSYAEFVETFAPPAQAEETAERQTGSTPERSINRDKLVWKIRYEDEQAIFSANDFSGLEIVAKLLARPN
jgi:hypothetical protein